MATAKQLLFFLDTDDTRPTVSVEHRSTGAFKTHDPKALCQVDLQQVDCENVTASDSQDDESEGRSRRTTQLPNLAETGFEKVFTLG